MDEMKIMPDDKLDAELKSLKGKEVVFKTLIIISTVAIFLFTFMDLVPVGLICLVLSIVFMGNASNLRNKIIKLLSENVINVVLKDLLGDDVEYKPWDKIPPGSMMVPFSYCEENGSLQGDEH